MTSTQRMHYNGTQLRTTQAATKKPSLQGDSNKRKAIPKANTDLRDHFYIGWVVDHEGSETGREKGLASLVDGAGQ